MANPWTVFKHDGFSFIGGLHDRKAVKDRRIDAWDIREDDVIITTFPKSGTTWMLRLVSEMYPDLHWQLKPTNLAARPCYFYEDADLLSGIYAVHVKAVQTTLHEMPSPRLMYCHAPVEFFHSAWRENSTRCKVIYITRNPKDVCVSMFHYLNSDRKNWTWDEFVTRFVNGDVIFGPWTNHVIGWKRFGIEDGVLHVKYEDMKTDLKSVILKISQFLSRPIDEDQLNRALKRSCFRSMKEAGDDVNLMPCRDENSWWAGGPSFRNGRVGDWKSHFTVSQNEMFDQRISEIMKENCTKLTYE
ncbi:sulfotransferase 1 family member D1-like [Saccoglossus kowalevskii]|uniref:Sulfotransferase 1 family member D1-like n=1 Tax=Saccoglossus kowalevskii TaxID=10224 RepID=A0ABM0GK00_SACKO|nr:PREDICTED: sulfotransferase 1 family member D1-like [Saccoglossus kowalevskii]